MTVVERLEQRCLLHGAVADVHVQFAPAKVTPAEGYVLDIGAAFGQQGELQYGWTQGRARPKLRRDSPLSVDVRYDGFAQIARGAVWEIALPNGSYSVQLVAGDSKAKRGSYGLDVEGTAAMRGETDRSQRWVESTTTVNVTDGRLTVTSAPGFKRNKINFIDITPTGADTTAPPPPVPEPIPSDKLGDWRRGRSAPAARAEAVGAAVGGRLFIFGGIDGDGGDFAFPVTARADVYDVASDTWQRLSDMPEPFTHTSAVVDGETIWFAGGFVGDTPGPGSSHVWKYDTTSDTWSRGPDLPEPRGGGAAALVGRTLHYFGGANRDRTADMPTHWSLDLDAASATWIRKADMPTARNHMAAATVAGKIYAVGGQRGERDAAVDLADIDVYDPATDSWTPAAPAPDRRSHTNCSTLVLNDKLLVIGGESGPGQYHREVFAYDPVTNAWTTFAHLPDARSTAVAGIALGQLVVATGNAPGISDDTWIAPLI